MRSASREVWTHVRAAARAEATIALPVSATNASNSALVAGVAPRRRKLARAAVSGSSTSVPSGRRSLMRYSPATSPVSVT
ncbi:MAG: hypothetical protein ACR2LK_02990 [Solirubrobacteraceae bacterium]